MNDLQAFITGTLMGALMFSEYLTVEIEPITDEHGNYQPRFYVTGRKSGVRLVVTVEEIEE